MVIVVVVSVLAGMVVGWFAGPICARVVGVTISAPPVLTAPVTGLVAGLTALGIGPAWALPAYLWIAIAGSLLAVIDVEHHRLPDRLTLTSIPAVGLLLLLPAVVDGSWSCYGRAWLGALAMFAFYFILALIYPAGMGMGDVKLAAVLGLGLGFLGWKFVVVGLFAAFFIGALVSLVLLVLRRANRKTAIPFGPFMLAGALVAVLYAEQITDFYVSAPVG
ncbi:MAG: prepilin peptidase [Candidatus Nanopelagicales bacterium]